MGKPAARVGDPTSHGGTISGPGVPTVLIGGMPAATLGDMHVCPMVTPGTPPIPHVGGPINLGSTGVFIGGKPAARMGDMAICVGPPSTILMGCPTVLIGEIGGGVGGSGAGAAGSGSGGGSAVIGAATSASIAGKEPPTTELTDNFLNVTFIDKANLPIGGLSYKMTGPDNSVQSGVLGGQIKRNGIQEGDYEITLRGITNARWSEKHADVGKSVNLIIDTLGVENGEKANIDIYIRDSNYADHLVKKVETEVNDHSIQIEWTLQVDESFLRICETKNKSKKYSTPYFFFKVVIAELSGQSGLLYFNDWAKINVQNSTGKAYANAKYKATLSTGEIREGTLDSTGKANLVSITAGIVQIKIRPENH